jgi:hypothetical protein
MSLYFVDISTYFSLSTAVYFLFPETNGRHLEEVDAIFMDSTGIFDTVSVANKLPRGLAAHHIRGQNDGTAGHIAGHPVGDVEKSEHSTQEEV